MQLDLGVNYKSIGARRTRIDISPAQHKALFGHATPRLIGVGCFAAVYAISDSRVVKITTDGNDVGNLLQAQNLSEVVRIHKAYKFENPGVAVKTARLVDVYALIAERLNPLPLRYEKYLSQFPDRLIEDDYLYFEGDLKVFSLTPKIFRLIDRRCQKFRRKHECREVLFEVCHIFEMLARCDIFWEDMRADNLGLDATGRLKILDLGIASTELPELPILRS